MREEIKFLRKALQLDLGIKFENLFVYIIQRTLLGFMFGNSLLHAYGELCLPLKLWWHDTFDEIITSRTGFFQEQRK